MTTNTDPDPQTSRPQRPEAGLHDQQEWLRVTLASIGDAVITTDLNGAVTFLNPMAESLTGWTQVEAEGVPLDHVLKIFNAEDRRGADSPTARAFRDGEVVCLANHSLLIARDGTERPIEDNAAPIRNAAGDIAGVVLVFRDVTTRRQQEKQEQVALAYAANIISTLREPFLVLDKNLTVKTANASFYTAFHVPKDETEGRSLFDLGDGQWDIPRLRSLLEAVT